MPSLGGVAVRRWLFVHRAQIVPVLGCAVGLALFSSLLGILPPTELPVVGHPL
jgi:hypothetical protein